MRSAAGEKAQRRWANTEALAHFEAALKRLDAMPDTDGNRLRRIDAVLKQSEIMFALGRHAEHVRRWRRSATSSTRRPIPPRRAAWYYWLGFLHSLAACRPIARSRTAGAASAIADATGLDEIRAFAECCLAHVYGFAGEPPGAIEAGERALPSSRRAATSGGRAGRCGS